MSAFPIRVNVLIMPLRNCYVFTGKSGKDKKTRGISAIKP